MSDKPPYICEPADQSKGRPATFIFIHGYSDDAEGLPLGKQWQILWQEWADIYDTGLAQQFQWHNKMEYLRWVLPNAPFMEGNRSWYTPRPLSNALKPRVPGHEEDDPEAADDEDGILKTCAEIDQLVKEAIDAGVEPGRIVVGGFSQGCAVSLVWGLIGEQRDKVAGCFCASGYFPLTENVAKYRKERGITVSKDDEKMKWLYIHGSKDILVPRRYFEHGKTELLKWTNEENLEEHMYEGMGHSTCNAELRDLLIWLSKIIPP